MTDPVKNTEALSSRGTAWFTKSKASFPDIPVPHLHAEAIDLIGPGASLGIVVTKLQSFFSQVIR